MLEAHHRGIDRLRETDIVADLRRRLRKDEKYAVEGVSGSAVPFVVSLLAENLGRPVFYILCDEDDMDGRKEELRIWTREAPVHLHPYVKPGISSLEHGPLSRQMKSVRAMLEADTEKGIWLTSLPALTSACFSIDFIDRPVIEFVPGNEINTVEIAGELERRGFQRQDRVEQRGDYAARGGIIDIFPHFASTPVRIEFYGDEVETLREFNPITQRSVRSLSRFVLDDMDFDAVQNLRRDANIEDYLPEDAVFFIEDYRMAATELTPEQKQNPFLKELLSPDGKYPCVRFEKKHDKAIADFAASQLDAQSYSIEDAAKFLNGKADGNEKEVFYVEPHDTRLKISASTGPNVWCLQGRLGNNFEVAALNAEIYSERSLVQVVGDEMPTADPFDEFIDLELGDFVVHEEYGIGQFMGMRTLGKDESDRGDYLLLQFHGGTKIYVPVSQLHLVQRYIGRSEGMPELSRVGTKAWEMKKNRARRAIERIVMELVHRQAFREEKNGFAFSPDTKELRSFELRFPWTETECQLRAIDRIKKDMMSDKPMDHLLCGDVGFGKTEVAIRAAMKAILDGKQVAVLTPTTILAEQHYRCFVERFAERADEVAIVNRFHTPTENAKALAAAEAGKVKVLIGTHRLLSRDVKFSDMGLLIIDEEQRFGVKQKEGLKKRFPAVDVLSISATPIPRSLHMAMLGIRNISNLTIAPENRLAIRTYIREYDLGIIRHAILRELERGGQAYFLHNEVSTMPRMHDILKTLFPQARIGFGHGQMAEKELASVMKRFYAREFDIFLASSIIANGIDIPTANTMIINNAHRFGLSELHQIRGRIGRYNIQAYAYLLVPKNTPLAKTSMRRLKAIEEHQELGAGYRIAMRDMEIRGVGNILGEDQHGHIADIGYELYTQYLAQAIAEAKGSPEAPRPETEIVWPIGSCYFPDHYIPSHSDRIALYRRISFAKNTRQIQRVQEEIRDRFGAPPKPALTLFRFFQCKIRMQDLGFQSFKRQKGGESVAVQFHANWKDEDKLRWVLENQEELAFQNEKIILLKLPKIWDRIHAYSENNDPYHKYSYYNEESKIDIIEMLEATVDFCERTRSQEKEKTL